MTKHNTIGKGKKQRAVNGGNDDYYTKDHVAESCVASLFAMISDKRRRITSRKFIEPSAGNGAFVRALASQGATTPSILCYDIQPRNDVIVKADWFDVTIPEGSIVVGNPPFGFAASLAVQFFNHAANQNAKVIAFIVPRSFQKQSVQKRLHRNYHLQQEKILHPESFVMPDGTGKAVPCVWQIWIRKAQPRKAIRKIENVWFDFVDQRHADFAVRRVGGRAGQVLQGRNHTASSTYFIRAYDRSRIKELRDAIGALDFSGYIDQTVGVRSLSKQELLAALSTYMSVEAKQ